MTIVMILSPLLLSLYWLYTRLTAGL